MGVVQNDGGGVQLLRKADGASETQPLSLCPCGNPRERKVGDKMVVVVESTDVAVATWKQQFNDLALVALERNILEELPRLIA